MAKGSFQSACWLPFRNLLKRSRICMSLVYRVRGIEFVDNLQDLDRLLEDIARRHPVFDHEAIAEASKICYRLRGLKLPEDDSSVAYAHKQMELYEYLSGRNRQALAQSEGELETGGDPTRVGTQMDTPPPMLGRQMIVAGTIIRAMNLPPGSTVVELGAGCGNMTEQLTRAGYRVTAVEINPAYAERIKSRMEQSGRDVRIINQDMLAFVRDSSDEYDAALFVASFHHCMEHAALLRHLSDRMAQKGVICFADEPVFQAENPFLPYSWGMRLDGQSLYFMRRYGWLELGFQSSYLQRVLSQLGWKMEWRPARAEGCADLVVASREHETGR
jgi:SAM-dependent methyltransferase